MNEGERNALLGFSIFLMFIGTIIAFALPYDITSEYTYYDPFTNRYETVTSTITVYGHPIGWVVDGIGFFIFLGALVIHPNGSKPSTQRTFQGKVCGNCYWFGKEECKRKEKMFGAMPCEDFTP